MKETDVLIIGGGLAGLSAAVHLQKKNIKFLLLEADERPGGRIKTDVVDGFRLDHGFQVLLTAYPEAERILDYSALNLQPFLAGSHILWEGGQFEIGDPIRNPKSALSTIFSASGRISDKLRVLWLRNLLRKSSIEQIFEKPEIPTYQVLAEYGFSPKMVNNFFRPFLSGIFLESDLVTSRRMFEFVFKMFAEGDTAVPAFGMEEIPKQLAAKLDSNHLLFKQKVKSITSKKVVTEDDKSFKAKKILLATAAPDFASKYLAQKTISKQSVTCVYFQTHKAPLKKPMVILNAWKDSFVNNLAVMSEVSPYYAPPGKSLISVSINGINNLSDSDLSAQIRNELSVWFGDDVYAWQMLKKYPIEYALPGQSSVKNDLKIEEIKKSESIYLAGDHMMNGSINAALKAGRLAAEVIGEDLK